MKGMTTIGLDLAEAVFQLHGVNQAGRAVLQRLFRHSEMLGVFQKPFGRLVGMEACSVMRYWAQELTQLGHEVRLMQPSYVKAYVQ